MKLNQKSASGLQLPADKTDYVVFDDDLPGFGIRLRKGGSRSWVFQYTLGNKQRRMSLGSATAIPLAKARETAADLHAKVRLGQDPAGQKAESKQQAAETFEAVATSYLAARKRDMRPSAYDQVDRHLMKYCKPLHGLQLANVTQRAIATRLNELRDKAGVVQANRTRSSLHAFYRWAMQQGIVTQNPVANTGRFEERSRERTLTDDELREIWEAAGDDHYGSIVKLLMLTGQRADEMASLAWSELRKVEVPKSRIDGVELPAFTIDAIDLPPERTKNGRPHIVPLSKLALTIIEAQPQRVGNDGALRDFVFGIGNSGFSGWSKSKERLDQRILEARVNAWQDTGCKGPGPGAMAHWTHHDLRRSLDTIMNDRLGIAPHVVEAILNHVSGVRSAKSGVAGVYNRALYLRERGEALRMWGDHITALLGEKGISLQAAE
jgi:integrase